MVYHIIVPAFGTAFYVWASCWLKYYSENNKLKIIPKKFIHGYSITHNTLLSSFSFYTFVQLFSVLISKGIHAKHNYYMCNSIVKNTIFWFYISKYYEYTDTFILYFNGKTPIFLQKYHHVGAAIMWHLCYVYDIDMIFFGSLLNSGVHSIMYAYYLASLLHIRLRGIRVYITSLQMAQLLTGLTAGSYYYYPPVETKWNYFIICFCQCYIIGLLLLFSHFMITNYAIKNK
jgi:hypothetical protein